MINELNPISKSCKMEVQQSENLQINFKNKTITLHNVKITKNPKIITIDASQYANFMKGSPIKLNNATTNTSPVKFQIPTLVPMKKPPTFSNSVSIKINTPTNFLGLNQGSDTKQVPQLNSPQAIQTIPSKNGTIQLKTSLVSRSMFNNSVRFQTVTKQQQPNVIFCPTKTIDSNVTPMKIELKPKQNLPVNSLVLNASLGMKTPSPKVAGPQFMVKLPVQPKLIISPPQKNKVSPCIIASQEAKRICKKLEFHCIFCKDVFDDTSLLTEHLKQKHSEPVAPNVNINKIEEIPNEDAPSGLGKKLTTIESTSGVNEVLTNANDEKTEEEDDDESEVNDLVMDLEETQDTTASDQSRSETPESPEFEQLVPLKSMKAEVKEPTYKKVHENIEDDEDSLDYESFEYFSNILEPICELSFKDDSNDGVQDENEAMRLYREAMEVNYQQNGIKKRGRRKQRKPKPSIENTTSFNGILAGLLENSSIKVPIGPGRGRRKEMNITELEMDRSNGVCLFSCNKCEESFKYAGDLAKHVRSHTISSPYQCSICQRKFTHIGSLNTHLRIHSGERPYKCNQCDKSFTQSNSLMVHVKSHLSNKPFQCQQCNKGFLNVSSLALHTKTHTGPATCICPIGACGKEFRDNNLLEEHMMTHRQSMLYQCSLCSEKFEQSCLLVQHVKTHIGDKPFQVKQFLLLVALLTNQYISFSNC